MTEAVASSDGYEHYDCCHGCHACTELLVTCRNASQDHWRFVLDMRSPLHQAELEREIEAVLKKAPGFFVVKMQVLRITYDH